MEFYSYLMQCFPVALKEGKMSIEEAMQQAEELGVNSSYHEVSTEETIFNFGIYKYTKNRASCSRGILQVSEFHLLYL